MQAESADAFLQSLYFIYDLVGQLVLDGHGTQCGGVFTRLAEALCQVQLLLVKVQLFLCLFDKLAHALTGNAKVLCDLSEREIVVVVIVQDASFAVGQDVALKVQKISDAQVFCKHFGLQKRSLAR